MSFPWSKPVAPWVKDQEESALAEAMALYISRVILGRKQKEPSNEDR